MHALAATGEPESLWGKITYKFGDLARSAAPTTDKVEKMRKRAATNQTSSAVAPRNKRAAGESVLSATITGSAGYQPKTKETQRAYDALLDTLSRMVGDVSHELLSGFAEEVLFRLKNDAVQPKEKRRSLENDVFQHTLTDEQYQHLSSQCNAITDFTDDIETQEAEKVDDDFGVSLVFEDDNAEGPAGGGGGEGGDGDDDNAISNFEVRDGSDDEAEDDIAPTALGAPTTENADDDEMQEETLAVEGGGLSAELNDDGIGGRRGAGGASGISGDVVDPTTIDAHWLQRQVARTVTQDAIEAKKLSEQVRSTFVCCLAGCCVLVGSVSIYVSRARRRWHCACVRFSLS